MQKIKNILLTMFIFLFVFALVVIANTDITLPSSEDLTQEATASQSLNDEEQTTVKQQESTQISTPTTFVTTEAPQSTTSFSAVDTHWGDVSGSSENDIQANNGKSVVFFTDKIDSASLISVYKALNVDYEYQKSAVKLSTGETGSNYLSPTLIKELVSLVNGTIVECNTAYGGTRASTAMHYQLAKDHGYTDIAEVVIMDEKEAVEIPVEGGTRLKTNLVGARFKEFDFFVILSHFKGHSMAGFGGALKNTSIGIASSEGKRLIHTAGTSTQTIYYDDVNAFHESMAEAAKSVSDALDKKIVYINIMNNLSVDCDCDSEPAVPTMKDIGILASTDPVALDKACIDLVYAAEDGKDLIARIESLNGSHILTHAEKIGLGSQEYTLVNIND